MSGSTRWSTTVCGIAVPLCMLAAGSCPQPVVDSEMTVDGSGAVDFELTAISAGSESDVWAVGDASGSGPPRTFAQHWNGHDWTHVETPNLPHNTGCRFYGVAERSANDVWAVGDGGGGHLGDVGLIEHWDGTRWGIVPAGAVPGNGLTLAGVDAPNARSAWTAGSYSGHGSSHPVVEHWDGHAWSTETLPRVKRNAVLWSVKQVAPDDVWAVGETSKGFSFQPLAFHFDGSTWTRVNVPNLPPSQAQYGSEIGALSSTGPDDVWAAGTGIGDFATVGVVLHWDGTAWRRSAIFHGESGDTVSLHAIASPKGDGAWVAGWDSSESAFIARHTANGWSGALPVDHHLGDLLYGVAAGRGWAIAVGYHLGQSHLVPLHLNWDGKTWRRT